MQTIGRETSQINMSICQIDDTFYRNFPQKHGWVMLGDIVAQITESSSVDLSDHQESEVFGGWLFNLRAWHDYYTLNR